MRKAVSLIVIIVLATAGLVMVESASAQSTPKPSSPEFTVKFVDNSYDVAPTYGTDQYTGKTIVTREGYHVDNKSIEFTFKNQQFTPYTDSSGNNIRLYYNFRFKGDYGQVWSYYPENSDGRSVVHYNGGLGNDFEMYPPTYPASNSSYTVISLRLSLLDPPIGGQAIPEGVTVDFQVQALIGYFTRNEFGYVILTGKSSEWSNTQTVTIGENSTSTAKPNPTIGPSNPTTVPTLTPSATPITPNGSVDLTSIPLSVFIAVTIALTITILVMALLLLRRQHGK